MLRILWTIVLFMLLHGDMKSQTTQTDEKDALRREYIDNFINDYKSAYEKERIKYIENFFSNKALIITETRELLASGPELVPATIKERQYKTLVENRKEYIDRLNVIFDSNRKITLGIPKVNVSRHRKYPEIYGVAFHQIWLDQDGGLNLEDDMPGYVFLLIDFKNSEVQPTIHVRTWQPQANITKNSDKYGIYDFRVYDLHK